VYLPVVTCYRLLKSNSNGTLQNRKKKKPELASFWPFTIKGRPVNAIPVL